MEMFLIYPRQKENVLDLYIQDKKRMSWIYPRQKENVLDLSKTKRKCPRFIHDIKRRCPGFLQDKKKMF